MCGRFTQHYSATELRDALDVQATGRNLRARYNIAPTTDVEVVRAGEAGRELVSMRWGLVPVWWKKSLKDVPATFNARAETVAEKPMFRSAFKARRCIIPASGFYEWTGKAGSKQPHLFTAGDGSPVLALAGLWEHWRNPDNGDDMLSCTIIVSGASQWMTPYHDRMPVLLAADQRGPWLDGSMGADALRPAPESALREWIVSNRVNRTGHGDDDPALIEPVKAAA